MVGLYLFDHTVHDVNEDARLSTAHMAEGRDPLASFAAPLFFGGGIRCDGMFGRTKAAARAGRSDRGATGDRSGRFEELPPAKFLV